MDKHKVKQREERKRKVKGSPDTGQGAGGDFGSDGDVGKDRVSGNDDKSKNDTQDGSPVPVKRQD